MLRWTGGSKQSIDMIVKPILDLGHGYSRLPTPAMRARDEACKSLRGELKRALVEAPASVASSDLEVAIGGRQGSYSPLAWVPGFYEINSQTPTAGIYLAYP